VRSRCRTFWSWSGEAGTTWFHDRLRRHPEVYMPAVKELHYFNREGSNAERSGNGETKDLKWHASHFREAGQEEAVGEVTPMYLCDEAAPSRIHDRLPDVKLIACLRYPVDRAYSHYWMARGKGHTSISFEEVVQSREARFIERGRYARQIERYLDYFERDQILILIHEEVFDAPSESLNAICSFLGIEDTLKSLTSITHLRFDEWKALWWRIDAWRARSVQKIKEPETA